MRVAIPEPSMPSRLNLRPAVWMIRRLVSCLRSFPYRPPRSSSHWQDGLPSVSLYYIMIVIQYKQESMMTTTQPGALVTGRTSGIGKAAALALADAGFEVIGTGRNTARITPRGGVTYLDLDVSSDESAAPVVQQVIERFGRLDVLVNNAGIGSAGAAEENSVVQAQSVFDVNVFGLIRMTKAVLPHMRAQGSGRIINICSVLGFLPAPYGALYAASKHAVEGYSESVDHEVREHGVRVLLV